MNAAQCGERAAAVGVGVASSTPIGVSVVAPSGSPGSLKVGSV
ncbi:MAG TPA: hypothetical protein VK453_14855 [Micromonosporaceae bacterium]|nr:hypothetical protein [Micromonosporaceae bacterium]